MMQKYIYKLNLPESPVSNKQKKSTSNLPKEFRKRKYLGSQQQLQLVLSSQH